LRLDVISSIFKEYNIWFLYLNHEACRDSNDKWLTRLQGRLQVLTIVKQVKYLRRIGQVK